MTTRNLMNVDGSFLTDDSSIAEGFFAFKANGSPPVGSATATRQKDQPVTMQRYALNGGAPARQLHRGIEPRPEPM